MTTPTHSTSPSIDGSLRTFTSARAFPVSPNSPKIRTVNAHLRTVSESAVNHTSHHGRIDSIFSEPHKPTQKAATTSPSPENEYLATTSVITLHKSNSVKQIKDIKDQMSNLQGRITFLTERTRRDSLRRKSLNNMRGTPLNDIFQPPEPVFTNKDANTSTASFHTVAEDWQKEESVLEKTSNVSEDDSECETPRSIFPPLRKSMSFEELGYDTAFSVPGEESTPIVSYPRRNRVRAVRTGSSSGSDTSSATTTGLQLPVMPVGVLSLSRADSYTSVSSYETAIEDNSVEMIQRPFTVQHQRSFSRSSPLRNPPTDIIEEHEYEDMNPNDDGYHSAPPTPTLEINDLMETASIDTAEPITGTATAKRISPLTTENLKQMQLLLPPTSAAAKSATNSIIGAEDNELSLKLPQEDRRLIESLCEQLGKVCCRMEASEPYERSLVRKRLEMALQVLQG